MTVDRISSTKYATFGDGGREMVVHSPRRRRLDFHLKVLHSNQVFSQRPHEASIELRRPFSRIVSPHQHPLCPRFDHPEDTETDSLFVCAGLEHPPEHRGPEVNVLRQIDFDDDGQCACDRSRSFKRQVQVFGDL
jgi:hypothetical protein